ncbi:MAG: TlpA family protein disulfide reductase [Flavobacteriales bacterium]|nr:TlpA family protein disulfide reductase [Flavobacteriales bacterium]
MSKIIKNLLFVAALVIIGGFIYLKLSAANEGDPAPEINAVLADGTPFKLSDLQGDYVLLDFWGSWCGPCRAKSPKLIALHEKYKPKLKIVSVALEKDAKAAEIAAKRDGFTWKYRIVEESSFVMMSPTAQDYGVTEIPTMFLISPEGVLLGEKSIEEVEEIMSKV